MNMSSIRVQIQNLETALEEQKSLEIPSLEIDGKCLAEMKKLQECFFQDNQKKNLRSEDERFAYTVLLETEDSFASGIERAKCESVASRIFPVTWQDGDLARDDILGVCLPEVLERWLKAETGEEERAIAKARILSFLMNPGQTELNLSSLFLKEIPDIFCGEIAKRLTVLHVSFNQLKSLPASIGNLRNLRELYADSNLLELLPESIGKLSRLEGLCIPDNKLILLPENVGGLNRLRWVDLSHNSLGSLPNSIGILRELETLDISSNPIDLLPPSIRTLTKLKWLYADCISSSIKSLECDFPIEEGSLDCNGAVENLLALNPRLMSFEEVIP